MLKMANYRIIVRIHSGKHVFLLKEMKSTISDLFVKVLKMGIE